MSARDLNSLELFVGAGGLALGLDRAGCATKAAVDWNEHAVDTLRLNQNRGMAPVVDWLVERADIRAFDYAPFHGEIDIVAGGPPCQPFSLGGKHRGYDDRRDMFPEAVRAVRELRPTAFVFENVPGLLRKSFSRYFEYLLLQLQHPDLAKKSNEDWQRHLARLEKIHTSGGRSEPAYRIVYALLNAADYGAPQRRERVFIVGTRRDKDVSFSFPAPTHSAESLLRAQVLTSDYWERHRVPKKARPEVTERAKQRAKKRSLIADSTQPWVTVRDAIAGLPDPERQPKRASQILNHEFRPGARSYPGHTGSPIDEPAKTLKAGDHGVPGGENMLVYPDGRLRYFTVRESARLQTFPDDYALSGSWTEAMRQLGNAVPVSLAQAVGAELVSKLRSA